MIIPGENPIASSDPTYLMFLKSRNAIMGLVVHCLELHDDCHLCYLGVFSRSSTR